MLAILVLIQGFVSVWEGLRYHSYVLSTLREERIERPWPRVTVVVPCKGVDHELEENLKAVIRQDSPAHEIIFVSAREDDPAQEICRKLQAELPLLPIQCLVAGTSDQRGEKVNNLLEAVRKADPSTEVFVFADSDAKPSQSWLRELVSPLDTQGPPVGATTGYRWYFPEFGNPSGVLRSAWNAGIATLLGPHDRNFCWGGSTAIRRETFERVRVGDYWQHSISDDYSMTQALKDAHLSIRFVPQCLLPSRGRTTWREVVQWSTRQLIITRVYSNKLWKLAAVSQSVFALTVLLGSALLPREWGLFFSSGMSFSTSTARFGVLPVTAFLLAIFLLGFVRGFFRWLSVRSILPSHHENLDHFGWTYVFLPPLISLFSAYILWRSALTNRVEWRDRVYKLMSSQEVKVLR
ncbi:MAG: glycosyltransferase [Terriglobia bacterium]